MKRCPVILLGIFLALLAAGSIWYEYLVFGTVVTMLSAFWSAAATVILGAVAVWQNKRYKELSDKSAAATAAMQQEIRVLTENTAKAIDVLKRIEEAKYYPALELEGSAAYSLSGKSLRESDLSYTATQLVLLNCALDDYDQPLESLLDRYDSCLFLVKNIGEKTIVNFSCEADSFRINDKKPSSILTWSCDIPSGGTAVVAFINLPLQKDAFPLVLDMSFCLQTLLMDSYQFHWREFFIQDDRDPAPTHFTAEFSAPQKIAPEAGVPGVAAQPKK